MYFSFECIMQTQGTKIKRNKRELVQLNLSAIPSSYLETTQQSLMSQYNNEVPSHTWQSGYHQQNNK